MPKSTFITSIVTILSFLKSMLKNMRGQEGYFFKKNKKELCNYAAYSGHVSKGSVEKSVSIGF